MGNCGYHCDPTLPLHIELIRYHVNVYVCMFYVSNEISQGHVENFTDPLIECRSCHHRQR
jgi:hypothetical protein